MNLHENEMGVGASVTDQKVIVYFAFPCGPGTSYNHISLNVDEVNKLIHDLQQAREALLPGEPLNLPKLTR
jgi:hypothetical protein